MWVANQGGGVFGDTLCLEASPTPLDVAFAVEDLFTYTSGFFFTENCVCNGRFVVSEGGVEDPPKLPS